MAMALPLLRILPSCLYHSSVSSLFLPSSPFSTRTPSGLTLPLHHRWVSALTALSGGTAAAAMEKTAETSEASRTRLIAQNIPWASTDDDIKALFAKHGTVLDIELSMYNGSRNRGLAFVTMASENEAVAALNHLNSYDLDGRVIKVEFARSVKKTPVTEAEPVPKYNVFVGNLSRRVRSQDLREFFSGSGNVLSAKLIYHTNPRRPAGYGFISFSSKEDAEAAIATYNGKDYNNLEPLHNKFDLCII
ncbi:29 kDa ribonucleoprotein B, chloroplastic-like isoform X2 [Zingiber officinale]|uniref:29 kDa ribonucleoprotein B, chloroplastic-like isoform X2 n=1 Tax=Zingiber officinale TaxID=94328 RepID=UPI001C4DD70B|nr:29 kDa ribonucleoprotein B, chloroplastic-like isoform X2 [Zingiber officinale]